MATPRILHLVSTLDRAGLARQLVLLARALPRDAREMHVFTLVRGGVLEDALREAGVPVTVIGQRGPVDPWAWWRLRREVARLRPDLVHAWGFSASVYGYAAARACGVRRLIATWPKAPGNAVEWAIARYIAGRGDLVLTPSAAVRDLCIEEGLPAEKIDLVPLGVPLARPAVITRAQLLAELGLPEGSRLIGLFGRLELRERIKDAIWAADLLKVIRDDVHLLVIGDGPHRDRLRRYRDQVLIADKVHFLGERADVQQWLPHLDVFWSASGCEGQAGAVLEAMAAGVPVVAVDVASHRELIADGVTGHLVALGHRAGFARWTNQLLDDPAAARRLGDAGRERAVQEFSAEAMVRGYREAYDLCASS